MKQRIVAELMIPGRGGPVENGTVPLDSAVIEYAGPTSGAPPSKPVLGHGS